MRFLQLTTLLWLSFGFFAICEVVLATNGASSSSGSTKTSLFSRLKSLWKPTPQVTVLDKLESYVPVSQEVRSLWNEGVQKGYLHPQTGDPMKVDGQRSREEMIFLRNFHGKIAPFIEEAAKKFR